MGTGELGKRLRIAATVAAVLAAPALLSACAATDGSATKRIADSFFGRDKPDDISPDYFRRQVYCPPVRVRDGTEAFVVYERGHESEPDFVRHQASITRTARECSPTADGLAIKVGVAGRVVAGPKGGAAELRLPIRVVVSKQSGGVLYSELFNLPVAIPPSQLGADFSQVVHDVAVPVGPEDRDLIVFVGFDEGARG